MIKYNLNKEKLEVRLSGELDVNEAIDLRKELLEYINQGYNKIVVNVEELNNIDSTGLGVLVTANKLARNREGNVYIEGLKGYVKKIFQLTRLDRVFQIGHD